MTHPAVHPETPHVAVASACILGEVRCGIIARTRSSGSTSRTPASGAIILRAKEHFRIDAPERVAFIALTPDQDVVIAGFKSGLAFNLKSGAVEPIVSPDKDKPNNRINDGHVGPDGAIYFGTMDDEEKEGSGAFWRWDGKELTQFHSGIIVTNGPAFSPDGQRLYATDTIDCTVYVLDAQGPDRQAAPLRPLRRGMGPSGWNGGRCGGLCLGLPLGRLAHHPLRAGWVGGAHRAGSDRAGDEMRLRWAGSPTLYITTAAIGRDPHIDVMAGHLFKVETGGIRGLQAHIFEGWNHDHRALRHPQRAGCLAGLAQGT